MNKTLSIKVDVDTLKGYNEGVPNLLDLFKKYRIRASFFFSFGPDNSGKAIRRIFRPGFLKKMLRTNAPGTYGLSTLFYGTLLPAPLIVPSNPKVFLRAIEEGHECGIHAWDHVAWQDELDSMPERTMREHFKKAYNMFCDLASFSPKACAAPAWKVTAKSLSMQDEYNFTYCSDTRGTSPFIPMMEGKVFKTLQIPTTLPTMDEIYNTPGINDRTINDYIMKLLRPGLNVHTIHAEMEGRSKIGLLEDLLKKLLKEGFDIITLEEAMKGLDLSKLRTCEIKSATILGRAGTVALQDAPLT